MIEGAGVMKNLSILFTLLSAVGLSACNDVVSATSLPAPTVSISQIPGAVKGASSIQVNFSNQVVEQKQIVAANFLYAADGINFTPVAALNPTATSYQWSIPAVDVATAKIKVTATDNRGFSSEQVSNVFSILSTPPLITLTSNNALKSNAITATFTGTCKAGDAIIFFPGLTSTTSTAMAAHYANVVAPTCSAQGTWSLTDTEATLIEIFSYTLRQTDAVGNFTQVAFTWNRTEINSSICTANPTAAACSTAPQVTSAGVVTILFTLSQIPEESATLILANAIKYATPITSPKILFVKDYATNGEDEGDPDYIQNTLLAGYNSTYQLIPADGLTPAMVAGYDLVVVSNPGYPLTSVASLTTLNAFAGGVILIGDDLSQGDGFSIESLTGLQFVNNGTGMSCNGQYYNYDNNAGYAYPVTMNSTFLPGIPAQYLNYTYGNDLDWTTADAGVEVLATATAAAGTCNIGVVPAIVRHPR
jgi:hypothetical protein